jgi:hypothetical protein
MPSPLDVDFAALPRTVSLASYCSFQRYIMPNT